MNKENTEVKFIKTLKLKKGSKYIIFMPTMYTGEQFERIGLAMEKLGFPKGDISIWHEPEPEKIRVAEIIEKLNKK